MHLFSGKRLGKNMLFSLHIFVCLTAALLRNSIALMFSNITSIFRDFTVCKSVQDWWHFSWCMHVGNVYFKQICPTTLLFPAHSISKNQKGTEINWNLSVCGIYSPLCYAQSSTWCMSQNTVQLFEQIRVQKPDLFSFDWFLWSGQNWEWSETIAYARLKKQTEKHWCHYGFFCPDL